MAITNDTNASFHQNSGSGGLGHSRTGTTVRSGEGPSTDLQASVQEQGYQKILFTDPVAFRAVEEDPCTTVLNRDCALTGYEIYIVEQWACSRSHPSFVINTYTGDPSHTAVVDILNVPTDEAKWSPRLKIYLEAMAQSHARRQDTPLGTLMVANLSSFPSSLTVIAVPDGDVSKHRDDFIVNENLKRLGCSGRAGLSLKHPTPATEAKFYQLYRVNERVPLYSAAIELVKLCQTALSMFDKLKLENVDGLLCDVTERAINDWWADIGTELYNIEPSDGILGPTTVSALLGTFMGARNRLHAIGAPVAKEAFDPESFKRGVGSFQKAQKLERTRRLDQPTLDKLHRVTAKAASGEGWVVPRAVKSTVAEFGGKGGEMVMGMVGGRDKAGIADIETLDLDRFAQLVTGGRSKWMWLGKPRKLTGDVSRHDTADQESTSTKRKDPTLGYSSGRPSLESEPSWRFTESPAAIESRDPQLRLALKKSVTGKVSDARAGFGRFRDAVGLPGLRSHHHKSSKESIDAEVEQPDPQVADSRSTQAHVAGTFNNEKVAKRDPTAEDDNEANKDHQEPSSGVPADSYDGASALDPDQKATAVTSEVNEQSQVYTQPCDGPQVDVEVSPGLFDEPSHELSHIDSPTTVTRVLRRPRSSVFPLSQTAIETPDPHYSRHLSFSAVEEPILPWNDVGDLDEISKADITPEDAILYEDMLIDDERAIESKIADLDEAVVPWVEHNVSAVEQLERTAGERWDDLNFVYQDKFDDHRSLREDSTNLVAKEGEIVLENTKKVELLGAKLDYELDVLDSKIEEVEDGLVDYERHVTEIELRVQRLVEDEKRKPSGASSWVGWGPRGRSQRP